VVGAEDDSWRVSYTDDHHALAVQIMRRVDGYPGFALVTGVPVDDLTPEQACVFAPELLKSVGDPLPQGPEGAMTLGWLVRDEGSSRFRSDGTYRPGVYTSKSADDLDIHNDGAMSPHGHEVDMFGLLCLGTASAGGESTLIRTHAVIDVLRRERPREFERLCQPYAFERSHVAQSGRAPVMWAPIFDLGGARPRVRCNRQRVEMAPAITGVPLDAGDLAALDALDEVLGRRALQHRLTLARGDLLVVDDHAVLHKRGAFTDDPAAGQRRCLVRVLLARPGKDGRP
jgi:hypothetical protein